MSNITDLRAAIKAALVAELDDTVEVVDHETGSIDAPSVVIANGDPWISQVDEEQAGFCFRVIRHRIAFIQADRFDAEAQEQFEDWADALPSILAAADVSALRMNPPSVTQVSAPTQITAGDKSFRAVFADVETVGPIS